MKTDTSRTVDGQRIRCPSSRNFIKPHRSAKYGVITRTEEWFIKCGGARTALRCLRVLAISRATPLDDRTDYHIADFFLN